MSSSFLPSSGGDAWFRIGPIEVTSTMTIVLLSAIGTILGAFASLGIYTVLVPSAVLQGEVWRIFLWPFVDGVSIWTIITFFVFWYFGTLIERELGRSKMASFLIAIWAVATLTHLGVGAVLPSGTLLYGIGVFQLVLLLLFIAESPNRPFLFGIPAWVLGAILVGLQVLQFAASRLWGGMLAVLITLTLSAIVARRFGLLTGLAWLPGAHTRRLRVVHPASGHPSRSRAKRKPPQAPVMHPHSSSQDPFEDRLNELLDKINASGIDSLTRHERAELERLSKQRRT